MDRDKNQTYQESLNNIFRGFDFIDEEKGYDLAEEIVLLGVPENERQTEILCSMIEADLGKRHIWDALVGSILIDGVEDGATSWIGALFKSHAQDFIDQTIRNANRVWAMANCLPQEYNEPAALGLVEILKNPARLGETNAGTQEIFEARAWKYLCLMVRNYPDLEGVFTSNPELFDTTMKKHGDTLTSGTKAFVGRLLLEKKAQESEGVRAMGNSGPEPKM